MRREVARRNHAERRVTIGEAHIAEMPSFVRQWKTHCPLCTDWRSGTFALLKQEFAKVGEKHFRSNSLACAMHLTWVFASAPSSYDSVDVLNTRPSRTRPINVRFISETLSILHKLRRLKKKQNVTIQTKKNSKRKSYEKRLRRINGTLFASLCRSLARTTRSRESPRKDLPIAGESFSPHGHGERVVPISFFHVSNGITKISFELEKFCLFHSGVKLWMSAL